MLPTAESNAGPEPEAAEPELAGDETELHPASTATTDIAIAMWATSRR